MHIANLNIKQIPQDFCVESCAMKDSLFFFFFFSLMKVNMDLKCCKRITDDCTPASQLLMVKT